MTRKFNPDALGDLAGRDLFERALSEVDELGPEPAPDDEEHWLWVEERRGAVELLTALSGWDSASLRRGILHLAHDERHRMAAELLRDAASVPVSDDPSPYRQNRHSGKPPSPRPRPPFLTLKLISHGSGDRLYWR